MSAFFLPLDELLSAESRVRILRVLLRSSDALSGREIARRSGVGLLSVQKAMPALVALQVVERRETSAQHLYTINATSYLVREGIAPLFAAEARRVEAVFERIRGILLEGVDAGESQVVYAALFGSAARGEDGLASDFDVLVVTRSDDAVWRCHSTLSAAAAGVEKEFGLRLSPVVLAIEELRRQHREGSPFIASLLADSRTILGHEEEVLHGYRGTEETD